MPIEEFEWNRIINHAKILNRKLKYVLWAIGASSIILWLYGNYITGFIVWFLFFPDWQEIYHLYIEKFKKKEVQML